jgi:hypothetical protein
LYDGPARKEKAVTGGAGKVAGWLWVGLFYILVLLAGMALVGGGTVLATFGWGMLQNDAWQMIAGIGFMVAGVAVFVGGVTLLFRITSIPAPRRLPDNANARIGEYAGYTDSGTYSSHSHDHGGGHDGGAGGGN